MGETLSAPLSRLVSATNLGRSTAHPQAGWLILTILYKEGSTSGEPMTLDFLVRTYNEGYRQPAESRVTYQVLQGVLTILEREARLVEALTRKVRERMSNGKFHIKTSTVYRINAAGIEYLKAMQRVVDAENTVVASTNRIQEYCHLIEHFQHYTELPTDTLALFDDFNRMLSAYEDVINGIRKLDVDLHEISTDLAFDRIGTAAMHLRQMLHDKALPAYAQMLQQAPLLQWLANQQDFAHRVALSRQADDNLDVAIALQDDAVLSLQRTETAAFVRRRLGRMVLSFDPSTTAIQTSFDSIYLLYQTLTEASTLLAREYEHVHKQTVDVQALTAQIDALLPQASQLWVPEALPVHLPMDRLTQYETEQLELQDQTTRMAMTADLARTVRGDMLEAGSMEPVTRSVSAASQRTVSVADNPEIALDRDLGVDWQSALEEFIEKVMVTDDTAQVTRDLTFTHGLTRDVVVMLYAACQYVDQRSFVAFGRPVVQATMTTDRPVRLRLSGETYQVSLPHGFTVTFEKVGVLHD